MPDLILASASPRRRELLVGLGLNFEIQPSTVTEPPHQGEDPGEYAAQLAKAKALSVAAGRQRGLIIGADTVVVLAGRVLGKPGDEEEAHKMLSQLSGRSHTVYTGVAVVNAATGESLVETVATKVFFRRLSQEEIAAYVASGEPLDKAGAYGIQGLGALLVERIEGCYFNVVGLPLSALDRLLRRFGFAILQKERMENKRTKYKI